MSEPSVKVIKCPKCGTERETTANTSAQCRNIECKAAIWVQSNLVSGTVDSKPAGEQQEPVKTRKKYTKRAKVEKTKVEKAKNSVLILERSDVLAAQVLADALNSGELCVGAAEMADSGDLVAVLCEHKDGQTIVHAVLQTPDSQTKFASVVPVMTL